MGFNYLPRYAVVEKLVAYYLHDENTEGKLNETETKNINRASTVYHVQLCSVLAL